MPCLFFSFQINAPIKVCFDLSRSVDVHMVTTAQTHEKVVSGVVAGLMELHDTVTWQAVHFTVKQRLTSVITEFDRPHLFVDEMVKGAFQGFRHEHKFNALSPTCTLVTETFDYTSPYGIVGKLADALMLKKYMTALLKRRHKIIQDIAESQQATTFLQIKKKISEAI